MTWGIPTCKKTTSNSIHQVRCKSPALACFNPELTVTIDFDSSTSKSAPTNGHIGSSHKRTTSTSSAIQSKKYLWSISFYAQFFDVDTNDVLKRCGAAVFPRSNFLDVLDGNPDLYGPFWIATTVVVILFLTGTMSKSLAGLNMEHAGYDFKLLSGMFRCAWTNVPAFLSVAIPALCANTDVVSRQAPPGLYTATQA